MVDLALALGATAEFFHSLGVADERGGCTQLAGVTGVRSWLA
jgi:hypothetical protein